MSKWLPTEGWWWKSNKVGGGGGRGVERRGAGGRGGCKVLSDAKQHTEHSYN